MNEGPCYHTFTSLISPSSLSKLSEESEKVIELSNYDHGRGEGGEPGLHPRWHCQH